MIKLVDIYHGGILAGAIEFLFELIAERMTEPEVNISATMPTMEQHRQFVHRRPYRAWYLIELTPQEPREGILGPIAFEPVRAGYISATDRNEIGIVLLKEYRGKGYGRAAVQELMRILEPLPAVPSMRRGRWVANINPLNAHSIRLFTSMGGKLIQQTYEL